MSWRSERSSAIVGSPDSRIAQGHGRRLDPGDDARSTPVPHAGEHLGKVAGGKVEAPGAMQPSVAHDAAQQVTAIAARGLDQQSDARYSGRL